MVRTKFFSNGKEVVDFFDKLLRDIHSSSKSSYIQPVALVLLDINMPIMTGLEAV